MKDQIFAFCFSFITLWIAFVVAFGSEPSTFSEWDMYTALILAFWGAFLNWRRF